MFREKREDVLETIKEESKDKPDSQSNFTKNKKSRKSVPLLTQETEGKNNEIYLSIFLTIITFY